MSKRPNFKKKPIEFSCIFCLVDYTNQIRYTDTWLSIGLYSLKARQSDKKNWNQMSSISHYYIEAFEEEWLTPKTTKARVVRYAIIQSPQWFSMLTHFFFIFCRYNQLRVESTRPILSRAYRANIPIINSQSVKNLGVSGIWKHWGVSNAIRCSSPTGTLPQRPS